MDESSGPRCRMRSNVGSPKGRFIVPRIPHICDHPNSNPSVAFIGLHRRQRMKEPKRQDPLASRTGSCHLLCSNTAKSSKYDGSLQALTVIPAAQPAADILQDVDALFPAPVQHPGNGGPQCFFLGPSGPEKSTKRTRFSPEAILSCLSKTAYATSREPLHAVRIQTLLCLIEDRVDQHFLEATRSESGSSLRHRVSDSSLRPRVTDLMPISWKIRPRLAR
jgi:hypothetical protein